MISIIICSRTSDISSELKHNIQSTIGADFELIVIDNSKNNYSIFAAYNEGVKRSKYPYLCFMHEDILYHTADWGKKVINHFKDVKIGLIGVVGGHYLTDFPTSWWSTKCMSGIALQRCSEINETYKIKTYNWVRYKDPNKNIISVAAVDGFWFCIPKRIFDIIRFDDIIYKGFHCYDLDICMQLIQNNFKVCVVFDILIEHFSQGARNVSWMNTLKTFNNKWFTFLPLIKGIELCDLERRDREEFALEIFEIEDSHFELERKLNKEINRILLSKAYRLGKFLLNPFLFISYKVLRK